MKGLMPLALSPSLSSNASHSSTEEKMGNKVDGYFPEVLAKDLERSSFVFEARSMTAGRPTAGLSVENKDVKQPWPCRTVNSSYNGASGPVQSLLPIQESNCSMSFVNPPCESRFDETSSEEEDSMMDDELLRALGERPTSFNGQSITTAATSLLLSSRGPSPKNSPACADQRTHSWVEADSDDDDEPELHMEDVEQNLAALSPRPPTPPESESSSGCGPDSQELHQPLHQSPTHRKKMHRKSHSVSGTALVSPQGKRRSVHYGPSTRQQPLEAPASPFQERPDKGGPGALSPVVRRRASSLHTPTTWKTSHRIRISHGRGDSQGSKKSIAATDPTYMGDVDTATDEEQPSQNAAASKSRNRVFIRPSPPPSPMPTVESWLHETTLQYAAQCPGDELAKAVPLPPDVVETLRVSVACFPETMLLSSSLTVETIRNYSKKVRHPTPEVANGHPSSGASSIVNGHGGAAPESPADNAPRRPLWKRVLPTKKSAPQGRQRHPLAGANGDIKSAISAPVEPSKPWLPLRNVFVNCSDYVLDALWAHIVAYNYISALVPRPPPKRTSTRDQADDNDEIPKKAASLLGLAISTDTCQQQHQQQQHHGGDHSGSKMRSHMPWSPIRDNMVVTEPSSRSASNESTTRDIQADLMRCIIRLISTAKLMGENTNGQQRIVELETRGVDILFTRSLCEIVRVAEEST